MPTLAVGLLYEEQQNLIHYQSPVCVFPSGHKLQMHLHKEAPDPSRVTGCEVCDDKDSWVLRP